MCFYSFKHRSQTLHVLGCVHKQTEFHPEKQDFQCGVSWECGKFQEGKPAYGSFYFLALYSFPGTSCHWIYYPWRAHIMFLS